MKKIIYNILIMACVSQLFPSCDGMMDVHKDYIKGGEFIYAPKADSVEFIAGKERILFNFWLYNSPNVKTVDVYWNGKLDSLLIPVSPSSGLDSFSVVIPNLPEKSYTFEVRTTDNFGHKSLWTTDFGSTYGATYLTTIANRRIKSIAMTENGGEINWLASPDGLVRVEVKYKKSDGTETIFNAPEEDETTLLPAALPGSSFQYRSLYIPEEASIDTFALDWTPYETAFSTIYLYDRSKWKVLACSDQTESDGGGMHTVIDGDNGTYWHSQWDGGNAPLPHWILIDLGKELSAAKFDFIRRNNNTDNKTVEIYLGDTPDAEEGAWTKVGETVVNANKMEIPSLDKSVKGRYLKLLFPDSNRDPFTNCAEIYMYGGN